MNSRGSFIVKLALQNKEKEKQIFNKTSNETYQANNELYPESNYLFEEPVNIDKTIEKVTDWINEQNFDEASVTVPESSLKNDRVVILDVQNLKLNFKKNDLDPKTTEITEKYAKCNNQLDYESLQPSENSYVSPSVIDDSDFDKDYLPYSEDDSKSTEKDSCVHADLSSTSSLEGSFAVGKADPITVELASDNMNIQRVFSKSEEISNKLQKKGSQRSVKKTKIGFSETTSTNISNLQQNIPEQVTESLANIIKRRKKLTNKLFQCKFCDDHIPNKNFMRHLQRRHKDESEVTEIFKFKKGSKERRRAFQLLRNNTNFDLFLTGVVKPNRQVIVTDDRQNSIFYPCPYCKGIFSKNYLSRHAKKCFSRGSVSSKSNVLTCSQTVTACAMDPVNVTSKLNVKEQVFDSMKADAIAFEAKKDLLIANFGESYLKRHKRERMTYACSNRMRELSRLLLSFREIVNDNKITLKELLHPKHFDNILLAARRVVGFDYEKKTFKAPSLGIHLGTSLKVVSDELVHLILKQSRGFKCKSTEDAKTWLTNIKYFKCLVESRWNIEMGSLANKDLQEKRWTKPLLLPLVNDVKIFRDAVTKMAGEAIDQLDNGKHDKKAFKLLNQCVLSLLIIFNRRRIGDVQYLKIEDYKTDKKSDYTDFESVLTDTEKALTNSYKRVLNSGKGSRAVVILIPKELEVMINALLKYRDDYILDKENNYVFAMPDSKIKWGKGDVALRSLTKKLQLQYPEAISSNRLRKQIATVTQILNLQPEEAKQFANFMGHTQKTHEEFYELPVDIYQTAKVSKLLLMMEKGTMPVEYKGKSLAEINFNADLEYVEEDRNEGEKDDKPGFYESQNPVEIVEDIRENVSSPVSINREKDFSNTEDQTSPAKRFKPNKGQRSNWSNKELLLLKKEFSTYISKGTYPSGEQIKEFLNKTHINRTVTIVKSKIQHLIKIKSN